LVAIKRTQYGTGMKLRPKFFGPYKVTKRLNHGRYEVKKEGGTKYYYDSSRIYETMGFIQGRMKIQDSRLWDMDILRDLQQPI